MKRILFMSDSFSLKTGYGNVIRNISKLNQSDLCVYSEEYNTINKPILTYILDLNNSNAQIENRKINRILEISHSDDKLKELTAGYSNLYKLTIKNTK